MSGDFFFLLGSAHLMIFRFISNTDHLRKAIAHLKKARDLYPPVKEGMAEIDKKMVYETNISIGYSYLILFKLNLYSSEIKTADKPSLVEAIASLGHAYDIQKSTEAVYALGLAHALYSQVWEETKEHVKDLRELRARVIQNGKRKRSKL
jgi:hypothetical protein